MPESRRILCILPSRELFEKLQPLFGRETLDLTTVTSGRASLVLLRNLAFDLILAEHPLADLGPDELVAEIRSPAAGGGETSVLILTRESPAELAGLLSGDPHLSCHSLEAEQEELLAIIAGRLGVAAREASRLLVQLELQMGPARILRACQTVDISESGMLVRTERMLPVATEVDLAFSLPTSRRSIQARGRVVRQAGSQREGHRGLGIQFTRIAEEDQLALASFLSELAAAQSSAAARGALPG